MNPILAILYSRGIEFTRSLLLNLEMARSLNKGELFLFSDGTLSNVESNLDLSTSVPKLRDLERDFGRGTVSGKLVFPSWTG